MCEFRPARSRPMLDAIQRLPGVCRSMTFDTPFIGGLCNCDQYCMAYRMQVGAGLTQTFFPAEYTALVDWDKCSGCKLCRGACPQGVIEIH